MKAIRLWAGAVVVLVVVVAATNSAASRLAYKAFDLALFLQSLMPLFVITVLIERTIEMFFGIWVEPGRIRLRSRAEQARAARLAAERAEEHGPIYTGSAHGAMWAADPAFMSKSGSTATVHQVAEAAARLEREALGQLEEEKAKKSPYAFLACLSLGVVVAIAGTRLVETLLADGQQPNMLFTMTDILLTGSLLGGGAEAFHQFAEVIKKFLQTTQAKLDAAKPGVPSVFGSRL